MKCFQCGMCCKLFNLPKILEQAEFQKYNNGDGICIYLKDNKCSIYENRPYFCNSDKLYNLKFKDLMTREEFDLVKEMGCKQIINQYYTLDDK